VTYTFTFDEAVTGFTASDITISGGTKGTFTPVSGTEYTLVITPDADSNTNMTVDVAANVAQDLNTNNNTVAIQSVQAVDTAAPSIVISDDTAGTASGDVTYTFTFSEAVTGFTAGDITISGGTKGTFTPVSGTEYTLVITPDADSNANITVDVAANVAQDLNSNNNTVAIQSVQAVDTAAPSITITDDTAGTASNAVTYTFTFDEAVTGFTAADVTISGGTKGTFTPVSGTEYTLVIMPDANSTTNITVDVAANVAQDLNTNNNTVAIQSMQAVDTVSPSITITDDMAGIASGDVTYTFTFDEAVTGFTAADITISGGTKGTFTPVSGTEYTLVITPDADSNANITVDVAANVAQDLNTNNNTVAIQSVQVVDTVEPLVSSVVMSDSALDVGETSILSITFSEAVTGLDNTDISLENGSLTAVSSSDGGLTWVGTFTPTDNIEDTTNIISVGTTLTDLAGNAPLAGNTTNYSIDTIHPNVAPTLAATGASPTFTENGAVADLFGTVSIDTIEPGQTVDELQFTISNITNGADEIIVIDGDDVALTNLNIGVTNTLSFGYSITLSGTTATVTLNTTGASVVEAQALVDGLAYKNTSDDPTAVNRVATLVSIKDSGGTAKAGSDSSVLSTASTVPVVAVNDAPTTSNPMTDQSVFEGDSLSFRLAADAFADVDSNVLTLTASLDDDSALPAWLSFDPTTRTFFGQPDEVDVGSYSVKVNAEDDSSGRVSDIFNITVVNVENTPVIGGISTGSVTEDIDPDGDGFLETSGVVSISNADAGESGFVAETISGAYGDLTINSNGNWNYVADNDQNSLMLLKSTEIAIDTFAVTTLDGSQTDITLSITGADDDLFVSVNSTSFVTQTNLDPDPEEETQNPRVTKLTIQSQTEGQPVTDEEETEVESGLESLEIDGLSEILSEHKLIQSPDSGSRDAVNKFTQPKSVDLLNLDLLEFQPENLELIMLQKLIRSNSFTSSLDDLENSLGKVVRDDGVRSQLNAATVAGLAVRISSGVMTWVLRTGTLLTSLFTVMPLWRQFDPLPVLASDENEDEDDEKDKDESTDALEDLFDRQNS